jgi:hypothetical protein
MFGTISRNGISRRRGPRASSLGPCGSKGGKGVFISLVFLEQFQQKREAVLCPELRESNGVEYFRTSI